VIFPAGNDDTAVMSGATPMRSRRPLLKRNSRAGTTSSPTMIDRAAALLKASRPEQRAIVAIDQSTADLLAARFAIERESGETPPPAPARASTPSPRASPPRRAEQPSSISASTSPTRPAVVDVAAKPAARVRSSRRVAAGAGCRGEPRRHTVWSRLGR
jgi:hypothetical protein